MLQCIINNYERNWTTVGLLLPVGRAYSTYTGYPYHQGYAQELDS
jgi:hypothetical protein